MDNWLGPHWPDVIPGLVWSKEKADQALLFDLSQFELDVSELVSVELTQIQFDALINFTFNVGSEKYSILSNGGLKNNTLLKKINLGDYLGAADEFLRWNKSNGKVLQGLTRRRSAKRNLFLS